MILLFPELYAYNILIRHETLKTKVHTLSKYIFVCEMMMVFIRCLALTLVLNFINYRLCHPYPFLYWLAQYIHRWTAQIYFALSQPYNVWLGTRLIIIIVLFCTTYYKIVLCWWYISFWWWVIIYGFKWIV